jgi:hypothetical protein
MQATPRQIQPVARSHSDQRARRVERSLCTAEWFGESRAIVSRVEAASKMALALFADDVAADIASASAWRHPLVRRCLADIWSRVRAGGEPVSPATAALLRECAAELGRSGDEPRARGGFDLYAGGPWIWTPTRYGRRLSEALDRLCHEAFPRLRFQLSPTRHADRDALAQGHALLASLLPDLCRSVFAHVLGIVIVEHAEGERAAGASLFLSASTDSTPGLIFLSRDALTDPHVTAESLLHEACHNKLYEIWSGLPVLAGKMEPESDRIPIPWSTASDWDSQTWELSRAMAAAHVYLHLMLLLELTQLHAESIDRRWGAVDRTAIGARKTDLAARLSYVASEMRRRAGTGRVRELGWTLLDWVEELARGLDAAPTSPATTAWSAS